MNHNTHYPTKITKLNISYTEIDELFDHIHGFVREGGKVYVLSSSICLTLSDFRARIQEVLSIAPNSYPLQINSDLVIIFVDKKECNRFREFLRFSTGNSVADMLASKLFRILEG